MFEIGPITLSDILTVLSIIFTILASVWGVKRIKRYRNVLKGNHAGGDIAGGNIAGGEVGLLSNPKAHTEQQNVLKNNIAGGDIAGGDIQK